jgi:hypothetical protein
MGNIVNNESAVILVYSTSYALRVEKFLKNAGIVCKLIPVPRHLSSDCGVCVRIASSDKDNALQTLNTAHVDFYGIYYV